MTSMAEFAKKVTFGKGDEPDKYGLTKKMHVILDLVDDGKTLEDADFKVTKADEEYYNNSKMWDDLSTAFNGGKKKKMVRFVNDIDPE